MPKVNDEYIKNKKDLIINAAKEVFEEKALYEMTMLDIIKKAGLSKGGIYRYYDDVDSVIIDFINTFTSSNNYAVEIENIVNKPVEARVKVSELLSLLGNRIENSPALLGKIQFELNILIATNKDRGIKILNSLDEQDSGQLLMYSLIHNIKTHLIENDLEPLMPFDDLITYIQAYIEGVVKMSVFERCYDIDQGGISPQVMLENLDKSLSVFMK